MSATFEKLVEGFPGNARTAIDQAPPLFADFRERGEKELQLRCLLLELDARVFLERLDEAEALLAQWEPVAKAEDWPSAQVKFCNIRGIIARKRLDFVAAATAFHEGLALAGSTIERGVFCSNLGNLFSLLGDFASAFDFLEQAVRHYEAAGEKRRLGAAFIYTGTACQKLGQFDRALSYFSKGLELLDEVHDASQRVYAWLSISECHGELGDVSSQRAAIQRAQTMLAAMHADDGARQRDETNVESVRGRFELKHGDAAAGRRILLELIDGNRLPVGSNASILALAIADHLETPPELALRMARQALAEAEKQGYQSELIGAHHSLYQLNKAHDLASAVAHLEKARELEQQQFAEKTAQQLQAVEVQQKTWQLGRELREEQRLREETARLLVEVETQKNHAEEANRAKTAILGITAHDLRNQIGSLLLGVERMAAAIQHPEKLPPLEKLAEMSLASGDEARELLSSLLDYSSIQEGSLTSRPETVDLIELVAAVTVEGEEAAQRKEQTVTATLPAVNGVMARLDPTRLRQVLQNLLGNAIKYAPPGTEIEVELALDGDAARIEVRDHGPGISADDEAHLFQAFRPLSNRPTGGESSTGLGLYIARAIVANEGGQIGYSARDGGGSVFWMEVPKG